MKITTGTNFFPSKAHALNYYKSYGFDRFGVENKIRLKEIKIGKPEIKEGQELKVIDNRWHICE
jgi:hypothetical protein